MTLEVMRSVNGRLEIVGGLDPFAQFDPEALTSEVKTRHRAKKTDNYAINSRMLEPEVEYNLKGAK